VEPRVDGPGAAAVASAKVARSEAALIAAML